MNNNNFNLLRLFFAWLVIVSHSFALLGSRDLLAMMLGTMSFGELAVDAFFVLSGYLISQSWLIKPSSKRFLSRRVARIVPGFIICVLMGVAMYLLFFDPMYIDNIWWGGFFRGLLVLKVNLPPAFPGYPYSNSGINGSLWTIHYEFFCYLGILMLGLSGLLARKFVIPLWVLLLAADMDFARLFLVIGSPHSLDSVQKSFYWTQWIRFSGCYLSGVVWCLYDAQIRLLAKKYIILIIPAFLLLLSHPTLYVCAVGMLFPLLLSYIAYSVKTLNGFWLRHDISYGVYLYAWPTQKVLIATMPGPLNPLILITLTSLIAGVLGWLSWIAVERPSMQFIRYLERANHTV